MESTLVANDATSATCGLPSATCGLPVHVKDVINDNESLLLTITVDMNDKPSKKLGLFQFFPTNCSKNTLILAKIRYLQHVAL